MRRSHGIFRDPEDFTGVQDVRGLMDPRGSSIQRTEGSSDVTLLPPHVF
jgi:hypothetical protein